MAELHACCQEAVWRHLENRAARPHKHPERDGGGTRAPQPRACSHVGSSDGTCPPGPQGLSSDLHPHSLLLHTTTSTESFPTLDENRGAQDLVLFAQVLPEGWGPCHPTFHANQLAFSSQSKAPGLNYDTGEASVCLGWRAGGTGTPRAQGLGYPEPKDWATQRPRVTTGAQESV